MRILYSTLIALLPLFSFSQQTIVDTITVNGLERSYILYVPETYEEGTNAPLVLNFHGYTSNALEQFLYSDFRPIADTAGFLLVCPQGTKDNLGTTHWNVGWGLSTVNDVAFVDALIDSIAADYSINLERIYSTGMSNGGFFSYKLACELSERIAAIASVTGSFNVGQGGTCNPEHQIPVLEIHGTADQTVPYEGNFAFASTPSVIEFWRAFNGCDVTPTVSQIPNTNQADGCTAEFYFYGDGNNGATVEHFKVIDGAHTWPGSAFGGVGTNQDFNASQEIWRFFSQYDIQGAILPTSVDGIVEQYDVAFYPNPWSAETTIHMDPVHGEFQVKVYNSLGQRQKVDMKIQEDKVVLQRSGLKAGIYYVEIKGAHFQFVKKMIVV